MLVSIHQISIVVIPNSVVSVTVNNCLGCRITVGNTVSRYVTVLFTVIRRMSLGINDKGFSHSMSARRIETIVKVGIVYVVEITIRTVNVFSCRLNSRKRYDIVTEHILAIVNGERFGVARNESVYGVLSYGAISVSSC